MWHRYFLYTILQLIVCLPGSRAAYTFIRDGTATLRGWHSLIYQAIRFEPLCGFGTTWGSTWDAGTACRPAVDYFVNSTKPLAFYDVTGQDLGAVRVGGGQELCMCFALMQSVSSTSATALCVFVHGNGQGEVWGENVMSNFRLGLAVDRSLPLCGGTFDLAAAKETWSRTAVEVAAVTSDTVSDSTAAPTSLQETTTTESNDIPDAITTPDSTVVSEAMTKTATKTVVSYSVTTYFPSGTPSISSLVTRILSISTVIDTITNVVAIPPTGTSATTIQQTVVTALATPQGQESRGLSSSEKLSLGLGLGIGLPAIALLIAGLCLLKCLVNRKPYYGPEAGGWGGIRDMSTVPR